ncbi:transcription antiterminator [Clostridium perfringens]|nr:PRD domain-containing protein [Clostridium perfringens]SUY46480.1 transcription antiterminator [Clostridium perfringens]
MVGSNDEKFIAFCEELILEISRDFSDELNEIIHIGLIDHISFAIERMKKGEILRNPFLVEIETLYPKSLKLQLKWLKNLRILQG